MPWKTEGDQLLCVEHGERFARGRSCPGCAVIPPAPIEIVEIRQGEAPEGVDRLSDHELRFCHMANFYEVQSRRKSYPASVRIKWADAAIKARRAAAECAREREQWDNRDKLIKANKAIKGRH